jgi:hypothetical protein
MTAKIVGTSSDGFVYFGARMPHSMLKSCELNTVGTENPCGDRRKNGQSMETRKWRSVSS